MLLAPIHTVSIWTCSVTDRPNLHALQFLLNIVPVNLYKQLLSSELIMAHQPQIQAMLPY